ncbi:stage II sporulation protein D [Paenibacillus sp. UNCCL117]|uniref:SpoIID/LytB domain-containing protein n=1 Tax=unclassified Paenibacillus TaxID=185978 RepID=UPI00087EAE02|nr:MULTISPECIES: SpoIID/LytB domain-containing protein [unclassified Paenibacillus]SDE60039.1 stage II sporulation protein D [Paenibacillus sp. cl123]SFW69427.1 stage II sporulation protein D [Paenibacillus sp. UNCCL117]
MKTSSYKFSLNMAVCTAVLTALSAGAWPAGTGYAAEAAPNPGGGAIKDAAAVTETRQPADNVRVALFIETGRYTSRASAVTLSSESGLTVALREASGLKPVHAAQGKEAVRAYLDGFYIQALVTPDSAAASAKLQTLKAAGTHAGIIARVKQGKQQYTVYQGPYANQAAADAAAKGVQGGAVLGPRHLNAGMFATEAEAAAQTAALVQAGFEADVAVTAGGFAAFVGAEADEAGLASLRTKIAAALPAVQLSDVAPGQAYVLKRSELIPGEQGLQAAAALIAGGDAKLWSLPANGAGGGVKVAERSGRSYRGGIEVSAFGGKLAVINEVPMDSYLYAVLGSELSPSWPIEALKAQAVAARTFVGKQGNKYEIAHVSDTTLDQFYKGIEAEFPAAQQAVDATRGEVLTYKGALIDPLFFSNAGGLTADSTEVWGNPVPYLVSVPSPDEGAQNGKKLWYRIVLPSGAIGYIHSDYAKDTGQKNAAGFPIYEANAADVNIRSAPYVDNTANPAIAKTEAGSRYVVIGETMESNAYSWIRGPYDAAKLKELLGGSLPASAAGGVRSLEVSKRGPSGRALEVSVNGEAVKSSYPDALRSLLGGLPSTRFEIEEWGRYTIQGAGGASRDGSSGQPLYVAGGSGAVQAYKPEQFFALSGDGTVKAVSVKPQFVFTGSGFGHGLGMSQWGAKGLAELGHDYTYILKTYYTGVALTKSAP